MAAIEAVKYNFYYSHDNMSEYTKAKSIMCE